MKKLISIILVVLAMVVGMAVILSGCCTAPDGTKSFANCLKTGQDKVCNATPEVLAVVDTVIEILKPVVNSFVPGSAVFNAYVTATNIKTTGCATLTEINNLITFIQGYNAKSMMAAQVGTKAPPQPYIDITPLESWANKK